MLKKKINIKFVTILNTNTSQLIRKENPKIKSLAKNTGIKKKGRDGRKKIKTYWVK